MNKKEQIKNYIISFIVRKKIKIGSIIPSENQLCQLFQISRNPVREALKELSYSNWIHPKKGRGYYVQGLGSYEAHFTKGAYQLNLTKVRNLRNDEEKFLQLIDTNKINNKKIFVKEYFDNKMLVIKSINLVTNDYLFYLSKQEIKNGFIQGLLKHKIPISHQDREICIINFNDKDIKNFGWENDYPVIITSLYIQQKLIEKSLQIIKKSHFYFSKKVIF